MKKRILFVDDEPQVLRGIRRMLEPMHTQWDMTFVESGQAALEQLDHAPFDVVVSDMRMPGINGVELLTAVMERYPHTIRIILSGYADQQMILQSVVPAHQYLSKPCDSDLLQATVARACALRDVMSDAVLQRMVSGLTTLPSLPTLYLAILDVMASPTGSLEQVGAIIAQDMAMTAKILQLVNSAFFGVRSQVSSPAQAVGLLGLETIKSLVLSIHIFEQCDAACLRQFNLESLWQHSHEIATWAKKIAKEVHQDKRVADDAYMAGLLHDVGKLVLATNLPDTYSEIYALMQDQGCRAWEAEQHVLGVTHAEVGAYLLELWGLPKPVVEGVAFHHSPLSSSQCMFSPLTAVHIANALGHETPDTEAEIAIPVEHDYLAALGLSDRLRDWYTAYEKITYEDNV